MPSHVVTRRSLSKRLLIPLLSAGVLILSAPIATASSAFLTLFDLTYSSLSDSNAGCALCHDQVDPSRSDPIVNNGYGVDLRAAGISTDIVGAFSAVEGFNSDGDSGGCTNIQEIDADAQPGWTGTAPSGVSGDLDPASCGDNPPPVVTNPGDQVSDENENVALQIDASDGDTLSYSAIGLPDGLSINASTGEISGTVSFDAVLHPASFQDYNVEVSVDDGVNTPVTVVFTWTIFDLNLNPIALDDSASTLENNSVDVQVLNNDSDADGDSLAISNVTNPTNGSVTDDGTIVTYTPDLNFNGLDSFDYTIDDGFNGSATATVDVNVTFVNDAPSLTTPIAQENFESDAVSLQVEASDPDGDALTYSAVDLPADLSIDPNSGLISGTVSFDAAAHPAIQDVYTVTVAVDDGVNLPASTSFDWVINDVNQAPVAVNDGPFTVIHDTSLVLDVLANDSDADGDTLTVVAITNHPANGMVTINADFTLTYTPDAGFVGDDPFTYSIDDGFGGSDEATVVVSVTNQAPEAVDDVYGTDQVTTLNIPAPGVLGNDSDADGDSLTSILSSNVSNGALTLNADGSFSYVPGSIGPDSFTYVANDGISDSNIATVAINVSEINLPPDVSNPGAQTNAETDLINLAVVASDPNGDTLSYSATGLPTGLSIDPASGVINGSVAYEAVGHPDLAVIYPVTVNVSDGDLVSSVSFDWTVDDVNQLPIAIDDGATTDPNTPVTVIVLSNDNDADNDTLAVSNITIMPLNGTVQINNDDSITYTPNTGFVSTDNFTYEVEDGFGGTATATVTISVVNIAPVAVDDTYSTEQDVELVVPAPGVLGNDSDADGDTLTAAPTSIAANGVVTLNDNGSFLYVPNAGYTGPDSFTYVANDGFVDSNEATVNINVTQGNLLPVADAGGPYEGTAGVELTFDGTGSNDPDGTIVSYLWTFGDGGTGTGPTPTHTYANAEIYTVTLEVTDDSGATDTAATVATIAPPPNVVPVAVDDSYSMLQDSALNILAPGVLGNDSDADGDPLTAALDSGPSNGAVNLNADGSFDYTPDAGFSGTDSFTYVASDGEDNSNIATVTISVDTVNYAPNVGSVADQSDAEESTVSLAVIADDPNGDALTYSATGLPPNLTINAGSGVISGVISLDAVNHPDLSASYAVTVTVSDGVLSSAVSFNWNVTDVNQDPVAVDDSASTTMDTAVTIDVLANDSDADGDALMVSGVGTAANGTAVNNGDGTVTYTPNTGFSGADSFTYTIEDGFGLAASATVTITVTDIIGDADVYLSSMRVPSILKLREDRETTRRINVFGDGVSIEQDATVTLSVAGHPGIEVEIDPASVISSVIPGGGDTRFTFSAEIECEEAGSYVLEWTAVINAAENEDPTNDTLTQSTAVECKASTSRRER